MEAIPRGLVSREMMKMIPGIKCVRTNVLPANSSGNYSWSASSNNRITFQVPQFPNSYVNTKRSFIRFLLKTSSNGVWFPRPTCFDGCFSSPAAVRSSRISTITIRSVVSSKT